MHERGCFTYKKKKIDEREEENYNIFMGFLAGLAHFFSIIKRRIHLYFILQVLLRKVMHKPGEKLAE